MTRAIQGGGVAITNLSAFRRDLKAAMGRAPTELTKALRAGGTPALDRVHQIAAHRTGRLASGYKIRAAGAKASLSNREPYSAGAEWGMHGKWKGFLKYPTAPGDSRGRFMWRAIRERETEIAETILRGLEEIVEINGWAR